MSQPKSKHSYRHLVVEQLEDRLLLFNYIWTGAGTSPNWIDPKNWKSDAPDAFFRPRAPRASDNAIFDGAVAVKGLETIVDFPIKVSDQGNRITSHLNYDLGVKLG